MPGREPWGVGCGLFSALSWVGVEYVLLRALSWEVWSAVRSGPSPEEVLSAVHSPLSEDVWSVDCSVPSPEVV